MDIAKQSELAFWLESVEFWRSNLSRWPVMYHYNYARKNLARAIRSAETKLKRPHRYLPKLGCVQYMGNGK